MSGTSLSAPQRQEHSTFVWMKRNCTSIPIPICRHLTDLTTWSEDGEKRNLQPETADYSDQSRIPRVTITPSDQVLGSPSAKIIPLVRRKKRAQELLSGPPIQPSNANGEGRSRALSLGATESARRNDVQAHTPGPEEDSFRKGLLYPDRIAYELQIQRGCQTSSGSHGWLGLNDANGYLNIERKADELVRQTCKEPPDAYYIHFRGGHCIEIRDNKKRPQVAVASPIQWKSMCLKLVKDFGDGQLEHCTLLISREYSIFELRPTESNNEDRDEHEDAFVINKACELRSLMKTNIDGKEYLPKIDLDGFTSEPMIRAVIKYSNRLEDLTEVTKEELIRKISLGARKLFTAFIVKNFSMRCFNKLMIGGYRDDNMPKHHQEEPFACCRSHNDVYNVLVKAINKFLPFSFKTGGHFPIERRCVIPILPVAVDQSHRSSDLSLSPTTANYGEQYDSAAPDEISKSRARLGKGAHARVYQVRIDPAHNEITSNRDELFALKEFQHSRSNREETMLTRIESYDKSHLTKRLASWSKGIDKWILFPLAECNLADYMNRYVFGGGAIETFWLLEQFIGLADALIFIHTLPSDVLPGDGSQPLSPLRTGKHDYHKPQSSGIGWHHDVKPHNILYFVDAETKKGCFQLCDYGSSKVDAFRSRSDPTSSRRGTPTYEPPETDEGSLSRPYDTWALGCVFLIVVTWALLDSADVEKFREDREGKRYQDLNNTDDAFWEKLPEEGPSLRKAVRDQIALLKDMAENPPYQIFSTALKVISDMLHVDKDKRIKMEDVFQQLQSEVSQAKAVWEQKNAASITGHAV